MFMYVRLITESVGYAAVCLPCPAATKSLEHGRATEDHARILASLPASSNSRAFLLISPPHPPLFATHDSPKERGRSRRRDERVLCPGGHPRPIPILQTSTLRRPFVLSRSPASLIRAPLAPSPSACVQITRLSSPCLCPASFATRARLAANANEAEDPRSDRPRKLCRLRLPLFLSLFFFFFF